MNRTTANRIAGPVISSNPTAIEIGIRPDKAIYSPGERVEISASIDGSIHRRGGGIQTEIIARCGIKAITIGDIAIIPGSPEILEYTIPIDITSDEITIEARPIAESQPIAQAEIRIAR